jgi:hypothetical protein
MTAQQLVRPEDTDHDHAETSAQPGDQAHADKVAPSPAFRSALADAALSASKKKLAKAPDDGDGPPPKKKKSSHARKKTSDIPSRIYSYRVLPPVTESTRVEDQFWLAEQYRNALVEIELRLRERFRAVQLAHPTVGAALQLYTDAVGGVENTYDDLREAKSGVADPDLSDLCLRLDSAKELRAGFGADLYEAKRTHNERLQIVLLAHPEIGPLLRSLKDEETPKEDRERIKDDLNAAKRMLFKASRASTDPDLALAAGYQLARDQAHDEKIAARADHSSRGLRTGTYDRVEKAVEQAVKSTKRPLHFERCDGTGSIGTQIIGGMTVSELHSCADTRLRLQALPENYWQLPRNRRRHAARVRAWLRIGSNPDRSPIFAEFPVTFHRPLPKDAIVRWAYVVRHRVGRHYEWRLQLTIESNTFRPSTQPVGEGACAIDLGWRRLFDDQKNMIGLRAGYLVDEAGREREILVPEKLWRGMGKVHDLAAIRDKEFDAARDRLIAWLRDRELSPWMTDRIAGLAQWRAPRKLQAIVDGWIGIDWTAWRAARAEGRKCNPSDFSSNTNRIDGDRAILASLQAWARQDRHLQNWQEHQRDRLIAHRRETWRLIAAELTRTYATILIENGTNRSPERQNTMKLTEIEGWDRPDPEEGDPSENREQHRMSRLAAVGALRADIAYMASKNGARIETEQTVNSTRECAWCSNVETFDARATIDHTCSSCSRTWDQDANACRNLLHRHGHSSGPVPPAPVDAAAAEAAAAAAAADAAVAEAAAEAKAAANAAVAEAKAAVGASDPTVNSSAVLASVVPKPSRSVTGSNAVAALGKLR